MVVKAKSAKTKGAKVKKTRAGQPSLFEVGDEVAILDHLGRPYVFDRVKSVRFFTYSINVVLEESKCVFDGRSGYSNKSSFYLRDRLAKATPELRTEHDKRKVIERIERAVRYDNMCNKLYKLPLADILSVWTVFEKAERQHAETKGEGA